MRKGGDSVTFTGSNSSNFTSSHRYIQLLLSVPPPLHNKRTVGIKNSCALSFHNYEPREPSYKLAIGTQLWPIWNPDLRQSDTFRNWHAMSHASWVSIKVFPFVSLRLSCFTSRVNNEIERDHSPCTQKRSISSVNYSCMCTGCIWLCIYEFGFSWFITRMIL
jgi:hypothetical protein